VKLREVPWRPAAAAVLLAGAGLTALWFLWPPDPSRSGFLGSVFIRQAIFTVAGVVLMAAAAWPHPAHFRRASYVLYGGALASLAALLRWVDPMRGTRGWISIGPFTLQPAEFAKIAAILALARFLSYGRWKDGPRGFAIACGIAALPAVLILMQPDLGTALLFAPVLWAMLVTAGTSRRLLIGAAAALVLALPVAYFTVMKPYQRERLTAFLKPRGQQHYQTQHALNATASGGFLGRGLGGAAASYPFTIPDRHTDFVFSAIGEELGFVGCTLVLLLYGVIFYELFRIAYTTREPFARLLVVGVAALLCAQVTINVGMTIGLMPTTGLTLPFISYGGSSLLTCFLGVGLAIGVGRHKMHTLRKGT
jgi:rod shape determining protein RodA